MKPYETLWTMFFYYQPQLFFSSEFLVAIIKWVFPKIVGFPPKSSHFNRVFPYFHHPFWGTHIFGNIQIVVGFPRVSFPPTGARRQIGCRVWCWTSTAPWVCVASMAEAARPFGDQGDLGTAKMGSKVWGVQGWLPKNILEMVMDTPTWFWDMFFCTSTHF